MATDNEHFLRQNLAHLVEIGRTSRAALAKASGTSVQNIGMLIRGDTRGGMQPLTLVRCAQAVGLSVEDLVTRDLRNTALDGIREMNAHYGPAGKTETISELELERLQDSIQVMLEQMVASRRLPNPAKFARACLLMYEISRQNGSKNATNSARRLLQTAYDDE